MPNFPPLHYRGSVGRQSGLAAAQGGVILVIGRVPRHLGYRAAAAPECAATILAPAASPLGDAVPRADAAARSRHDEYREHGEREVQVGVDQEKPPRQE